MRGLARTNDNQPMRHQWTCNCCGKQFDELPLSFGLHMPDPYFALKEAERESRAFITSDSCIIDHKHYFMIGCIEIPIVGLDKYFVWNAWVSLSQKKILIASGTYGKLKSAQTSPRCSAGYRTPSLSIPTLSVSRLQFNCETMACARRSHLNRQITHFLSNNETGFQSHALKK